MILISGVSGRLGGAILDAVGARADVLAVAGHPSTLPSGVDVLVLTGPPGGAAVPWARHVVYASLAGSGDGTPLAPAHRATEARLPGTATVLRNGWYAETAARLTAARADTAAASGVFTAPLGAGRLSVVARQDLADVAARVALESAADLGAGRPSRHAGRTYELEGVTAVGGDELAGLLGWVLGRRVRYEPAPPARGKLFESIAAGRLEATSTDLTALLPSAPRPALDVIERAVVARGRRFGGAAG
ncbi:hypothetical protein KZZ52_24335 [Dactylosporangium sp. AC04546]|uniref:hypothetical protein n=1 Tax=Dactylosporangium sp. AC04546 TaxID=2862460 RepID=UPI001EE062DA|nr:hypothetical protein [Dactylosporangium sp. AC04546]WVK88404.1 hypothetical protein KZZ52_24335 [Dactylosporangium sp. AC04546]